MNYTYLASQYCTPNISALDIFDDLPGGQLKYICYHVTTNSFYPFIQIMLALKQGSPSCTSSDISYLLLRNIKTDLKRLKCNTDTLTKDAYKGIFCAKIVEPCAKIVEPCAKIVEPCAKQNPDIALAFNSKSKDTMYALIDVSSVDILSLNLSRSEPIWFALPTEIVNINSICDIPIAEDVINLFTYLLPELGVLYKKNSRDNYLLPDIVYTRSKLKQAEFRTLFGPSRNKGYFHFCKSFKNAVQDAVQNAVEEDAVQNAVEEDAVEEDAVNRYALFIDDPLTVGISEDDLEDLLNKKYSSSNCIIIQNGDILVKKYELFQPLSYHVLNLETSNSIK